MTKRIEISGIHLVVDGDLQKYIVKKIHKIERYIPKASRASLQVEVKLKEEKSKDKKHCQCEIIMHLPGQDMTARETTVNMFAATDIVIAKLKTQLEKYRASHREHGKGRQNRRIRNFIGKISSR
ncbi:MAG: ribosome-associated translation inhibitor RaiA [Patescibacteria group bacterium]